MIIWLDRAELILVVSFAPLGLIFSLFSSYGGGLSMMRALWRFWLRYWRLGRLLIQLAVVAYVIWWLAAKACGTAELLRTVEPEGGDAVGQVGRSQRVAFAIVADLVMYGGLLIGAVCLSAAYALYLLRRPIAWGNDRSSASTSKPKPKRQAEERDQEVTRYYIDPSQL